jgi:hypothetical protein
VKNEAKRKMTYREWDRECRKAFAQRDAAKPGSRAAKTATRRISGLLSADHELETKRERRKREARDRKQHEKYLKANHMTFEQWERAVRRAYEAVRGNRRKPLTQPERRLLELISDTEHEPPTRLRRDHDRYLKTGDSKLRKAFVKYVYGHYTEIK